MKRKLFLLVFSFLVVDPSVANAQAEVLIEPEKADYAVYSALIDNYFSGSRARHSKNLLIIENRTTDEGQYHLTCDTGMAGQCKKPFADRLREVLGDVDQSAVDNFVLRNRAGRSLTASFAIEEKYVLVSKEKLKEAFEPCSSEAWDCWKNFFKRYPKASRITRLSAVGFNSERTQALVYLATSCGGLCGGGMIAFLVKEQERWKVVEKKQLWIS